MKIEAIGLKVSDPCNACRRGYFMVSAQLVKDIWEQYRQLLIFLAQEGAKLSIVGAQRSALVSNDLLSDLVQRSFLS